VKNGQSEQEVFTAAADASEDYSDAWKEKIILSAVECCREGVVYSTPPFPFRQRWDPQQQLKGQQGQKRKRKQRVDYGSLDGHEEAFDEYEGEEGDPSTTVLNYDDDEEDAADAETSSFLQGQVEDQLLNDIAAANDLPALPSDMSILKTARLADMVPGAVIAYKIAEVSAATKWCPEVSAYKTAIVLKDDDDENEDATADDGKKVGKGNDGLAFKVQLAVRDRVPAKYDEQGKRVFEAFEEIMEEDEVDDGVREVRFEELVEPRVVQAAGDA
jgi:hypothetical protein